MIWLDTVCAITIAAPPRRTAAVIRKFATAQQSPAPTPANLRPQRANVSVQQCRYIEPKFCCSKPWFLYSDTTETRVQVR